MSLQSPADQRAALTIGRLEVRRIEGIDDRFTIDALRPGINLVHGPNAIGKSRTAAAVQAVLWPDTASQRADLRSHLKISGDHWHVEIDGRQAIYQRNGTISTPPELSGIPSHHKDRYLLTLHGLMQAGNEQFAQEIQREAAGGYDLAVIRSDKKLNNAPKANPRSRFKALNDARQRVRELQRADQHLREQERSLGELRASLDAAIDARYRLDLLRLASEHVEAVEKLGEARIAREAFEDPIGTMSGEEYTRVQELIDELEKENQKRQETEFGLMRAAGDLEETGFAEEAPADTLLQGLRERLSRLRDRETAIRHAREEVAKYLAAVRGRRERIAANLTDAQLAALDSKGLRELSRLTREYGHADLKDAAHAELLAWLGTIEAPSDLERLRQGTELLARRLRLGDRDGVTTPSPLVKWTLLGAAVLISVEAVILAVDVSPVFFVLVLLAIPIAWVAVRRETSPAQEQVEKIRHEYARLHLQQPVGWTPEAVEPLLATLQSALADAWLEEQKAIRWAGLADRRQEAAAFRQSLQQRREAMLAEFGVAPTDADPETIRQLAAAIDGWREAIEALATCKALLDEAKREAATVLASINELLVRHGETAVDDEPGAAAAIEHLGQRIGKAREARREQADLRRRLEQEIAPRIAALGQEIAAIYDAAGVAPDDLAALKHRCDQVAPCREAQKNLEGAEVLARSARARLKASPEYITKSRQDIEYELVRARELAERCDEIQQEMSSIEADIRQAKRRTQLEEAIAEEARALDALQDSRERDCEQIAGWNVLEFVQNRNRDQNRPAVFKRANDLLVRFTSGAYELDLNDHNPPEFVARETASGTVLPLDHLSSGTRIQLLMAVRLAFIETSEQGPQLPLILDETLGNTDDVRANAIIDAAIEISRAGRQVIYFTAQRDEVVKWRARIAERSDAPECAIFDLAAIRGEAGTERAPIWEIDPSIFVPLHVPQDLDYDGARTHFNVAPVDLWADHIDGVDLWYLIPDVATLAALRGRHITQWGPYQAMYRRDELKGLICPDLHERATARAVVVETVRRNWQLGRPRPLTRECLQESGCISSKFFVAVVELAERGAWCGATLIAGLRDRQVSRFHTKTMDDLEEYFREHGYITDAEQRPDHEIRAVVRSEAHHAIEQDLLSVEEIDELLLSLAVEAAPAMSVAD